MEVCKPSYSPPNLHAICKSGPRVFAYLWSVVSGLLLSLCFSPFEQGWLGWFALLPLLVTPVRAPFLARLLQGYVFGATHWISTLYWLNEVGFGAGIVLGLYCAVYPMVWYVLISSFFKYQAGYVGQGYPANGSLPHFWELRPVGYLRLTVFAGCCWVMLEWVRGWMLTGFPWNRLGLSQWQGGDLALLSRYTGVEGLSFVLVTGNFLLLWLVKCLFDYFREKTSRERVMDDAKVLWYGVCLFVVVSALVVSERPLGAADHFLNIGAIQGNIPQNREGNVEVLNEAIDVYKELSLELARSEGGQDLDLLVWPESAIPAAVRHHTRSSLAVNAVLSEIDYPLLIGSVDLRSKAGGMAEPSGDSYRIVNSALMFSPEGKLTTYYDKIHCVPFGEYVPFGDVFPFLRKLTGIYEDTTPGSHYTLFPLDKETTGGVNICFEDVFPGISRTFTQRGAELLLTLTNDGWYAESAGSRQHMIHAVFRAIENKRPLFRSGNNSDTCLILPSGRVENRLVNKETGNPFFRGSGVYKVPIWKGTGLTFYTKWGDVFSWGCAMLSAVFLFRLLLAHVKLARDRAERFS